jgi:putative membrane protein insertion efficiency factor
VSVLARIRAVPRRAGLALIRAYQVARAGRPSPCRYVPSCSQYAYEAVELHGLAKGSALAARRIARCNPWGGSGFDPVPAPRHGKVSNA